MRPEKGPIWGANPRHGVAPDRSRSAAPPLGREQAPRAPRLHRHEGGPDPRAVPVVLRGARSSAPAFRSARALGSRSLGPAHHCGHAAAQALLPGPGGSAFAPLDLLPEELSHRRHRGRRYHQAPPAVLRDARQLLGRRILQAGRRGLCVGALDPGLRARTREHLDHGLRRRRRARPRPRRGGHRVLALDRDP
jgi:hypothetical protein